MDQSQELAKLKPVIRCLVMSHPNHCLTLTELERDFRNTEGYRIPFDRLGYPSVYHLLCGLTDTVQVYSANGRTMVKYVSTPAVAHVEQLLQNTRRSGQRKGRQLHVSFKENTQKHCSAVFRVPEIHDVKNNNYNSAQKPRPNSSGGAGWVQNHSKAHVTLPMRAKNLNGHSGHDNQSPKQPSQSTLNIAPVEKAKVTPAKPVPAATKGSTAKEEPTATKELTATKGTIAQEEPTAPKEPTVKKAEPVTAVMEESCEHVDGSIASTKPCSSVWDWINMLNMPSEVMGLSRTIPKVDVLSYFVEREITNVRVLHMLNPNRLWLRSAAQEPLVEKLYDELNECYNHIGSDRWRLETSKVQHGLYCAVLYEEVWQRGRIVGPLIGCRVKVHFIDTGLTELVDYRHLKFLANSFGTVPAQALNILDIILKQFNGAWLNEKFASIVSAQWTGSTYLSKSKDEYRKKKYTYNERYPSFFCIEEGHFPVMEEIRNALARGFDYEELYSRIPHVQKNGIVERITRNTCEQMVQMFGIKVVSEQEKKQNK
uniref:HTH OST-type domain-containing protein n=1 Tax=Anopheles quadriannulatus TaxID=34691 RepID=A0A182WT51_ANOQN